MRAVETISGHPALIGIALVLCLYTKNTPDANKNCVGVVFVRKENRK